MRKFATTLVVCSFVVAANGINIVVPNANTASPGPSNQAFPFNQGGMRYQQVFAGSQFGGASGPVTQFAYRVDESAGNPFGSTAVSVDIWLSHTTKNPQGLDTTFDNNHGGDKTLVFSGIMNISSAGTGAFDIIFDINDIFVYNGTGNLLMEAKVFNNPSTSQFDAAGTGVGVGGTPWTSRLWAFGTNAATGSTGGDDGMVTQFTIVPEPASMLALAAGIGAILSRRRRR